jgi:hypothetical protein
MVGGVVSCPRFVKWLEAVGQFNDEVLIVPEDRWLTVKMMDPAHFVAVYSRLDVSEPLYDAFAIDVNDVVKLLKHVRDDVQIVYDKERGRLFIKNEKFVLGINTLDASQFSQLKELNLVFDAKTEIDIEHYVRVIKNLRKSWVDPITFVAGKDYGVRIEAKTEFSSFTDSFGGPSTVEFYNGVTEVKANFGAIYLEKIANALKLLSRLPNATFATLELKTNRPARFTLKDTDLEFVVYIAPRID